MRSLTVWEPFGSFARLESGFEPFVDVFQAFRPEAPESRPGSRSYATADFYETHDGYVLRMDLPGLQKEDLNLLLEAGQLTVSGRRPSYQDEAHKYHLKETFSGEFTRTFTLPKGVDAEKVSAQVQDGVLVIQIPKRNEVKPRKIEIAAA